MLKLRKSITKLRRDQANEIFQTIIDIQPKEFAIGGLTRENIV
jgi:hypothetical protein